LSAGKIVCESPRFVISGGSRSRPAWDPIMHYRVQAAARRQRPQCRARAQGPLIAREERTRIDANPTRARDLDRVEVKRCEMAAAEPRLLEAAAEPRLLEAAAGPRLRERGYAA
jgi:hypothetical protein